VSPRKPNLHAVGSRKSAPRATAAQLLEQGDKIFRLVARGYTITEAGKEFDPPLSQQKASRLYNEALARVIESDTSLRQAMLERELESLRLLKKHWMGPALNGDDKAANIILKVVDRVANLAGLNQSLKIQISNQRVDATVAELVEILEGSAEDQVPRLLESGVLVIEAPVVESEEDEAEDEDETAAG
jgi:hypothetical protein